MINGIKNKVVTSIYELNYIGERGSSIYKQFGLLSHTISKIIFPEYEYVIYTNEYSFNKFKLNEVFNYPNVTIKIHELNSDFYNNVINPVRMKKINEGSIWDRIHSVDNYIEVIYNKLEFLLKESDNYSGNVVWVDAGLFGTSCGDIWRDYIVEIAHTEEFILKIFQEINENKFIALRGNGITPNYADAQKIKTLFNTDCKIISAGLFGGKTDLIIQYFKDYKNIITKMIDNDFFTSEQEVISILLNNHTDIKYFDFENWSDFQRAILKVMGRYSELEYKTETLCRL